MTIWVALASFFGAVLGATVPALVNLRGQHQEARTEWSQRLGRVMSALASDDQTTREIGKEMLADLIESNLGSDQDRELARRIARIDLSHRHVDAAAPVSDNGREGHEEQI